MMKRKTLPLLFSTLLLTAPVTQAASTLFELNPTISAVSFDYQAEVSFTVTFEPLAGTSVSIGGTTVLNQHFDEAASGSLTADTEANQLNYDAGSFEASYSGTDFGSNVIVTILGTDTGIDFLISPNSFRFDLPTFNAGSPISSTASSNLFVANPVNITMVKDFESSTTVSLIDFDVTLTDPQTSTVLINDELTDATSISSLLLFGTVSNPGNLTLQFDPFQSEPFNSIQVFDVSVGTLSVSLSTIETISNLEVTLAPVPLPAAVWLLLTALAGLMGLRRQV